jgi:hypothetical protein
MEFSKRGGFLRIFAFPRFTSRENSALAAPIVDNVLQSNMV